MAKLSRLGWIVAIIIALILSLYLSTMVFYTDTVFGNINMSIQFIILFGLWFYFISKLDISLSNSNYILLLQLSVLHTIMQLSAMIIAIIFNLTSETNVSGLTCIIFFGSILTIIELIVILSQVDWSKLKSKFNFTKRKNHMVNLSSKIKASLIIIDNRNSDKIKWK